MLEAILVENEEPAIDILKILLEKTRQVNVIESFLSGADALSRLKFIKPDVAFLDIEMSEINGLELAEKILEINSDVEIIFVTAYDQYALEAFRVNALDYLLKPLLLEDVEQTVARLKKRKGFSSAFSNSPLSGRVYCFGKLTVYGTASEQPIKWRTSKAEELFSYMLQNKEEAIPKWKICEALWPDCSFEKVDIHLHTTLYKMKKALASAYIKFDIKFSNGCYWMSLPGIYIDIAEFDSIVDSDIIAISEHTIEKYEKAFSLYKNEYLEGNDYIWSLTKRETYSKKCCQLAASLGKYYMKINDHAAAEKILRRVLEKFPLDESAHEMLLKLYFIKKDRILFVTHYNAMQELFKAELGIDPSDSIQALYRSMICSYIGSV